MEAEATTKPSRLRVTNATAAFVGGTYFPATDRFGQPGFPTVLQMLADKWRTDRARLVASANSVIAALQEHTQQVRARQ